jgi:hypothetical protein
VKSRPDGAELLRVARKLLREEFLDEVPAERRYEALMVANAMAIAAREVEAGDADMHKELRMLTELYGEKIVSESGAHPENQVAALNRGLAIDIRAGVMDGACAQGVRTLLRAQVTARLRISNPKHLKAAGLE